jgi:hypothetical protein
MDRRNEGRASTQLGGNKRLSSFWFPRSSAAPSLSRQAGEIARERMSRGIFAYPARGPAKIASCGRDMMKDMARQLSFLPSVPGATFLALLGLLGAVAACGSHEGNGSANESGSASGGNLFGDGDGDSAGDGDTMDDIHFEDPPGDGDGDSQCDREVRLAEVEVGEPSPFDVIIVADHSDSLSWSRDDLAAGLSDFLGQVRGHEVRFFVLTPTQYDETSKAARLPLGQQDVVEWADPETGESYTNAMTEYVQTCTISTGEEIVCPVEYEDVTEEYDAAGVWNFRMPEAVAAISPEMTDAEIDAQRDTISSAIIGLGLGGASDEQPVCTLRRYIAQAPELLPEHAIFLILSDEDDQSNPEDCVVTRSASARFSSGGSYYRMTTPAKIGRRLFDCVPVNDQGEPVGSPDPRIWNIGTCTESRACNEEELSLSTEACPAGHRVENCVIECTDGMATCSVGQSEAVGDPCAGAFTVLGVEWPSFESYCDARFPDATTWSECSFISVEGGGLSIGNTVDPLSNATTIPQMAAEFLQEATQVFGVGGFSVQLIGFDPTFSCAPEQGQSYLDNLKTLVDSPEDISPICGDYSGALAQAQTFATNLLENEYQLELNSDEGLDAVRIVSSDGTRRTLSMDQYVFTPTTGLLIIDQSTLLATDAAVDLEIGKACVVL